MILTRVSERKGREAAAFMAQRGKLKYRTDVFQVVRCQIQESDKWVNISRSQVCDTPLASHPLTLAFSHFLADYCFIVLQNNKTGKVLN